MPALLKGASEARVALLRGINVGGHNKVPMADLRRVFEGLGATNVETYIQSGNVVFDGALSAEDLADGILAHFAFSVPVVLRTAAELQRVAAEHPFAARTDDRKALHVMFLADKPSPAACKRLDPDRSPPDEFVVRGREIFVFYPNRSAGTKLTNAWFDKSLGTVSTARNWDTVERLAAMVRR